MATSVQTWLYLHGFNSSSQSAKARQLVAWADQQADVEVLAPDLPDDPGAVRDLLATLPGDAVIGSSLGGFYALYLHQLRNLPTVLINPALQPHKLLANRLGWQRHYHSDQQWLLTGEHLATWRAMAGELAPDRRCLLLMQMGDEIIDGRFTVDRLAGIRQIVEAGGNHSFAGFERYFSIIRQHCHP